MNNIDTDVNLEKDGLESSNETAGIDTDVLLETSDLRTSFRIGTQFYAAVDGVDLEVKRNEVFAMVGESGCGKTAMALSIMRLHNPNFTRIEGSVLYKGTDLLPLTKPELNKYRGSQIGMIFQDALSALNPLFRAGYQIEEVLMYHTDMNKNERKANTLSLLEQVGMKNPELVYTQYPYELSGGMRQRAMIACALVAGPDLVIADEPTTALDVTIQAQILDLLRKLQKDIGTTIILITHDLGVVAEMATRVAVMYAGQIVELGDVRSIFKNPQHPYTRSLMASIPAMGKNVDRLHVIKGLVPPLHLMPRTGCRFARRTPWMPAASHEEEPTYHDVGPGHKVLCTCHKDFHFENESRKGG